MAALKEKRTCGQKCEDFGHFVWNSEEGTSFGRTPEKWVYISLYYFAFYVVMTCLFCLAIWTLMYTLDPYAPDYQDQLKSPGVMVWPNTYGEEIVEITYNTSDKASWMKMTNIMDEFLKPYNDTKQLECNTYNCTKGKYFMQDTFTAPNHTKWACPFTQSMLGACSGFEDPTFGYNCTMPCVIIKMNRIISFLPTNHTKIPLYVNCTVLAYASHLVLHFYKVGGLPERQRSHEKLDDYSESLRPPARPYPSGINNDGEDNVDNIEYFPEGGAFDLSYFPYYGRLAQPTYVNPLVAVRFHLVKERKAKIQCRVVSDKISYENFHDPYEGKVIFQLKAVK